MAMVPVGREGKFQVGLVIDGMGGHLKGKEAARRVMATVQTSVFELLNAKKANRRGMLTTLAEQQRPGGMLAALGGRWRRGGMLAALGAVLGIADAAVYEEACRNANRQTDGRGATAVGCVINAKKQKLHVGHIGDARAYLLRGGVLTQLTADHSPVQEKVAAGVLTAEQARKDPERNLINRALGQSSQDKADLATHSLLPGDRVLLCSDGVHGVLSASQIWNTLRGEGSASDIAKALVDKAGRDSGDNMAAQVFFVH